MRRILFLLLITAGLPTATHADGGQVVITEVLPDPAGAREFVELHNPTADAIDLTDWQIQDTAGNTFTFTPETAPDHLVLAAGASVVVWGGGASDHRGPAWSKASVWNNGGDQVLLHDALGVRVDGMAYGDATWPDDPTQDVGPAPEPGASLAWYDGAWLEGAPTPGQQPATHGGTVGAHVQGVPPTIRLHQAPASSPPAAPVTLSFTVGDDNGDLATWSIIDAGTLRNGTMAGTHNVTVHAPSDRDTWQLRIEAEDEAGLRSNVTFSIRLEQAGLRITLPPGGLAFPAFPPGADEVVANGHITLSNDGDAAIAPRIDVSDLHGPGTIPVNGRLDLGVVDGNQTAWSPYSGPLTSLPSLGPGESIQLTFRLRDIPVPLPAGDYGTSFTVIA